MPEQRDWTVLVADMLRYSQFARAHVSDMARDDFLDDIKTIHAVTRCIEVIGEAARSVPEAIRAEAPNVPWAQIVGTRHILAHNYGRVDPELLWALMEGPLQSLEAELSALLAAPRG